MLRMNDTTIIAETNKVIAKILTKAWDQRSNKMVDLTLYIELRDEEDEPKPHVEKILSKLGFINQGIINVQMVDVTYDCEKLFLANK